MFLVRDIMYCKPGQARPMVQKFLALGKLGQNMGFGSMRVMTDVSAERYWTVVTEMEVESLHPGVTLDEARENTGWELKVATDVVQTEPPTDEELRLIREELDPEGAYTR